MMRQALVAAGFFVTTLGAALAEGGADLPVSDLTEALIAGDVSAAHALTSSYLARKVSLYAFQGMLETGGIFGQPGQFEFGAPVEMGDEVEVTGQFLPADGSAPRPVRFSWLKQDGEWRLNRFGF